LLAFVTTAASMMVLRRTAPDAPRVFRCPAPNVVGTLAILGCFYLFMSLPGLTIQRFLLWNAVGFAIYLLLRWFRSRAIAAA
jgi:APA family basic amino acid/polyamine antiporter